MQLRACHYQETCDIAGEAAAFSLILTADTRSEISPDPKLTHAILRNPGPGADQIRDDELVTRTFPSASSAVPVCHLTSQ
jgi:hypothetical protein